MKEQAINQSNNSGWLKYLVGPVIVGFLMLLGQPYVAKKMKIEEIILEQRLKAYENAINIMQRQLAYTKIKGKGIPEWYIPPEKTQPTQIEKNSAYALLAIYGKSDEIAEHFYAVSGAKEAKSTDVFKFVSAVRKELGVDEKGYTGDKMHYILNYPVDANGQKDKEPKDEQKL